MKKIIKLIRLFSGLNFLYFRKGMFILIYFEAAVKVHNDTQHNNKINGTLSITALIIMLSIVMLSVVMLNAYFIAMLRAILSVTMLSVIMLSVVALMSNSLTQQS